MFLALEFGPRGGKKSRLECDTCHKIFVCKGDLTFSENHSCSRRCRFDSTYFREKISQAQKGVKDGPHTQEHRVNIGLALQGRVISKEHRQKLSVVMLTGKHPFRGKKLSPDHCQKITDNNWWKGKVVPWFRSWMISDHTNWRDHVKKLFDYRCANCKCEEDLHAHHIVPCANAPDRTFDLNNGVCVCQSCHVEMHRLLKEDVNAYKDKITVLLMQKVE